MRIVVVNLAYDASAPDADALLSRYHSLTGWCEALAAAGTDVAAVQRFHSDAEVARRGVVYRLYDDGRFGRRRPPLWSAACHRLVARVNPDLVHINGLGFPAQTWALRRVLTERTAIVVQDHASGAPTRLAISPAQVIGRFVRRRLMRSADGFFFTAAAQADCWRRTGLIHPRKAVYQVLEASTSVKPILRAVARRETGIEGDPAVLWVGRLNANKDPLTVLDGFERCLDRLSSATLSMIFGADDLLTEVRNRVDRSPALTARVRLLGRIAQDRMAAYYSAADVFVAGSHHEGSGYALLEACACGVPPVVTDIPAFRAITGNGAIGALWPSDDVRALADALVRVSATGRLEARERVLEHFDRELSWPAIARAARDAYSDACARRRRESA
ncbi:MAG: hypothetical protein A3H97_00565 [Acidobacteria bacterium RIFCSPLOWO2_02_FULL_65_29]|nr:MAG: hypothetical protein A3H97_00565 [Acidobacteria bacterium RIFCSPLOWO2_02_FULL_65_29]